MRPLKLNYTFGKYQSLARTAGDYIRIIGSRYSLTPIEDADVIVLHCLPFQLEAFFRYYPALAGRYLIGYCLWEASELPASFAHLVRRLSEVWTCSEYCRSVFGRYHPNVVRIPFVVERDAGFSHEDTAAVRRLISYAEGRSYFLYIASLADRRKNVESLVRVFCRVAERMPDARLILKIQPGERPTLAHPGVVWVDAQLTDAQVNALYSLAFAYVSPHHAEGWGLTLSDAMLLGRPVLATGYSGNLEFMNAANSMLLGYREEPIRPEDRIHLFTGDMKWAYPDEDELADKLLWLYEHRGSGELAGRVERARQDIARFDRNAVEPIVLGRLKNLE